MRGGNDTNNRGIEIENRMKPKHNNHDNKGREEGRDHTYNRGIEIDNRIKPLH